MPAPSNVDVDSAVQSLMSQMLGHPRFKENYNVAKKAKNGELPIVVLVNIENMTNDRMSERLGALRDSVRLVFYNTGLFEVMADEGTIRTKVVRGAGGGMADPVQNSNKRDSPDLIVSGDIRHFSDAGGYHTYRLRLAIHSLSTGKVIWEGVQTNVILL